MVLFLERQHASRYFVQRRLLFHSVPKKLLCGHARNRASAFEVADFAFISGKTRTCLRLMADFRIQPAGQNFALWLPSALFTVVLEYIAAKAMLSLPLNSIRQAGMISRILGHNGDLLRYEFTLQSV